MANVNSPHGLRLHDTAGKSAYLSEYTIATGYATGIGEGDIVKMTGTGRNIEIAAAGEEDSIGVFKGCMYVNSQGEQVFSSQWPASQAATEIKALVYDDPSFTFVGQVDTFAADDAGTTVDWTVGTIDTATGLSTTQLDTTHATTGSLHLLGLAPQAKNAVGAYAKVLVRFLKHHLIVS